MHKLDRYIGTSVFLAILSVLGIIVGLVGSDLETGQPRFTFGVPELFDGVPLVAGAAIRFDGQITVVDPRSPQSPCYACIFPPEAQFEEVRCSTLGVFAPLVGVVGAMQAAEALSGINLQVEAISGMSLQIATAVEEQSAVGEDIQRNLDGIREAGQSTVAASGRSRHSAEHVASLVERLQLLAEQFRGNAQRG